MDRRTDTTKLTVVFCNFTNTPEKKKCFRKTVTRRGLNSWLTAWHSVRLLRKTVLYAFSDLLSHLFTYLLMVYFMALLGAQAF
jgi:hypothetical protein